MTEVVSEIKAKREAALAAAELARAAACLYRARSLATAAKLPELEKLIQGAITRAHRDAICIALMVKD